MKTLKKLLVMCAAFLVFAGVAKTEIKAADYSFDNAAITISKSADMNHSYSYNRLSDPTGKAKIVKIAQTKKIANITINTTKSGFSITPTKTGTTTMNITVKRGSSTKVHKIKLKIVKYKNPAKTFKIDGKEYKGKFNKKKIYTMTTPKKTKNVKIFVKPVAGYKVSSITYYYTNKDGSQTSLSLKNGQKFKLRAANGSVQVNFKKNSTGHIDNLALFF